MGPGGTFPALDAVLEAWLRRHRRHSGCMLWVAAGYGICIAALLVLLWRNW